MKNLIIFFDRVLYIISPLAIISFFFGAIVLVTDAIEYHNMIENFQNQGLVTNGTVSYIPGDGEDIQVDFTDANGNNRTNFIRSKQYPSSLIGELEVGQSVSVRYLLPEYEYDLIWETHFDLARAYHGYAYQPGGMILVCLIIIIIHPDFLFIFYMNNLSSGEKAK